MSRTQFLMTAASLVGLSLLGACGGGGGVNPIPTPAPAPTPTPVPTPTPTPTPTTNFDTAEFRRSNAVTASLAIGAYNAGATGANVTVAVIDSGVDATSLEFAGRISPLSRDAAGNRGVGDEDGHGTEVSGILLAARNNSGIHGVAFAATLLSIRADRPGSCATTEGCAYLSSAIASGIDTATTAGARVINLSLGGPSVNFAIASALGRATSSAAVVVISAGNDGKTEVDPFASSGVAAAAPGTVIVAGAIDEQRVIADFSNRAGAVANSYLVTLGVRVRSFDETGTPFLYSGTSEAAPIISGAAALLAGAFPTLSNVQIVDILLRTADDLGAPGTDAIYGRGALNITRAFQPIGGLSVAQVGLPINGITGALGAPLGDAGATGAALARVVARDAYERPYAINVAAALRRDPAGRLANSLLGDSLRSTGARLGAATLSFGVRGDAPVLAADQGWRGAVLAAGNPVAERRGQLVSGRALLALAGGRTLTLGFGSGLSGLADAATGAPGAPETLVAGQIARFGAWQRDLAGAVLAQRWGGWTASLAIGETRAGRVAGPDAQLLGDARASRAVLRLDRQFGALSLGLAGERIDERGALFGSRLAAPFGVTGGTTSSAALNAYWQHGGWSVSGEARIGTTSADLTGSGLFQRLSGLTSTAARLSLTRAGVFGADSLSLTVAQPLRAGGAVLLALGGDAPESIRLAPSGREIASEIGYTRALGPGWLSLGLFWRDQPGHIANAAADAGAALRFRLGL
jgi:hypothetical protein